jgi:hypothetical protein
MIYLALLLIPIFTWTNRQYGSDGKIIPNWVGMSIQGASLGGFIYLISHNIYAIYLIPLLIGGCYLMRVFGKGKGFPHPMNTSAEVERLSAVVEPIVNGIHGEYTHESAPDFAIKWKTTWTALAWSITSIVKYSVLAYIATPFALLGVPAMLAIGWIYKYCFKWFPNVYKDVAETTALGTDGNLYVVKREGGSLVESREIPTSEWGTGVYIGFVDFLILFLTATFI